MQKSTKNIELPTIFCGIRDLNNQSYQIAEAIFHSEFCVTFSLGFCHKTPEDLETCLRLILASSTFVIHLSYLGLIQFYFEHILSHLRLMQ